MRHVAVALVMFSVYFGGVSASARQFVQSSDIMSDLLSQGFTIVATTLAPLPGAPNVNMLLFTLQKGNAAYLCRFKFLQGNVPHALNYCFRLKP